MADIESVTATVDGTTYTVSSSSDDTYSTTVAAPDETSTVSVTASDTYDNTTTVSDTIYVNSDWLPPKMDWTADDFVNYTDYNRIMNNLYTLKSISTKLFPNYSILDMGDEQTYSSIPYASSYNKIEQNLETINTNTFNLDIGDTKTYYVNEHTIDYVELNRIESSLQRLYVIIKSSIDAMNRLSFTLSGEKGIKV